MHAICWFFSAMCQFYGNIRQRLVLQLLSLKHGNPSAASFVVLPHTFLFLSGQSSFIRSTMKSPLVFVAILSLGLCAPPPTIPAKDKGSAELNRIVSNSPRLDLFLNLPRKCDRAYDSLIRMLQNCKTGEDNGHPSLDYGCFLHIDFEHEDFKCESGTNEKFIR